jgi:hypothetical protein
MKNIELDQAELGILLGLVQDLVYNRPAHYDEAWGKDSACSLCTKILNEGLDANLLKIEDYKNRLEKVMHTLS